MPEEMAKATRELPRDAEVIELLKKLPPRARFRRDNCKGRVWSIAARHNAVARNHDTKVGQI